MLRLLVARSRWEAPVTITARAGFVGVTPVAPAVAIAATADKGGHWLLAADGGVFALGDVPYPGLGALPEPPPGRYGEDGWQAQGPWCNVPGRPDPGRREFRRL